MGGPLPGTATSLSALLNVISLWADLWNLHLSFYMLSPFFSLKISL